MGLHLLVALNDGPSVYISRYNKRSGSKLKPSHAVDNLGMAMSLVASTRGVALLPAYAQNFLPSSLTSRPLAGNIPTIDLAIAYKKSNESPILKLLLSRLDELVARASKTIGR
jgi:LysR family hca operon transcriptional activator